jgi:hypothetical protein
VGHGLRNPGNRSDFLLTTFDRPLWVAFRVPLELAPEAAQPREQT